MALAETTLSSALTAGGVSLVVASATSLSAGRLLRIDDELFQVTKGYVAASTTVPVLRGQSGTAQVAHPASARVVHGDAADFGNPGPGTPVSYPPAGRARQILSYSAAGAITLPTPGCDMLAMLNGTSVLAMTLANPTLDLDGSILIICGNGIAAHTVTYTAGFGNVGGTADVMTFGANQAQAFMCIAANEFWNMLGPLAVATANVSGPSLA